MRSRLPAAALVGVLAALVASCGGDSGSGFQSGTGGASASEITVGSTAMGTVLVDGQGRTLYVFTKDTQGKPSVCMGDCLKAWTPMREAEAGKGVDASKVDTVSGSDGSPQATYDGWPLYYFSEDTSVGDVTGQAVDGAWFVLEADGTIIRKAPSSGGQGGGY
jgi:predicted lipoprotein with Yx(FWY)xxD motif